MEVLRLFSKPLSKKAEELLQLYQDANDTVSHTNNLEEKILAYNEVINSCMASTKCKYDDELRRDKILYWAYHNIGDTLIGKNEKKSGYKFDKKNYINAIDYYHGALRASIENYEKFETLGKIAETYQKLGDEKSWLEISRKMIEYLEDYEKREAYVNLVKYLGGGEKAKDALEKALEFVIYEKVPLKNKCETTMGICSDLKKFYKKSGDEVNLVRIQNLEDKVRALIVK